jgi:hypothetical protein
MTLQQALAAAVPHAEQVIVDFKADVADKVKYSFPVSAGVCSADLVVVDNVTAHHSRKAVGVTSSRVVEACSSYCRFYS